MLDRQLTCSDRAAQEHRRITAGEPTLRIHSTSYRRKRIEPLHVPRSILGWDPAIRRCEQHARTPQKRRDEEVLAELRFIPLLHLEPSHM